MLCVLFCCVVWFRLSFLSSTFRHVSKAKRQFTQVCRKKHIWDKAWNRLCIPGGGGGGG